MDVSNKDVIDLKLEPSVKDDRKDPTTFLPDEPMSYELKPKKKKKKKKQEDPFKGIEEKVKLPTPTVYEPIENEVLDTQCDLESESMLETSHNMYDGDITIKVENIEVEMDLVDFANENSLLEEVKIEKTEAEEETDHQNDGLHPIFDEILENTKRYMESNVMDNVIRKKEPKRGTYVCKVCHLVFQTPRTLRVHQTRKHKFFKKLFTHICDLCGMSYDVKNSLVAHMKRKHGPNASEEDDKERTCDVCALVFKGMARLRMHMRRKHGSFEDSFKHACIHCGLTYDKYRSLAVHIQRKHSKAKKPENNEWYSCLFCPKVFTKRETYTRHVKRKHKTNNKIDPEELNIFDTCFNEETGEITCKECRLVFSSANYLKLHMRRKHNAFKENFRLKCRICHLSYDKLESLKRHIRRKHDQGSHCEVCNKQFDTREMYLNHSHENSARPVNECHLCGLIFANQGGLLKHLRCTHRQESPKKVFCKTCNEGFHDKRQLKSHYLKVHLKVSYTCRVCNKVFKAKESYRRHILCKHPIKNESSLCEQKCQECMEVFANEVELCRHVNEKHAKSFEGLTSTPLIIKTESISDGPHQCQKCSESFTVFADLRTHYNQNHVVVEETQCQICGQMLPMNDLQKHIKSIHNKMTCKYCDYQTDSKTSMTQHYLRHKNAKTLHCDVPNCRYKTYYESAMHKHRVKHNEQGVKFQCSQCPFQTMNKYILRYHEEAHVTGKKRYACDQCDYATVLPANLVQHKYKHSKEKRFKCEFCPFATKYNTSLRFHVKKKHCDLPN